MNEKKFDLKRFIYPAVITLLILFFVGGVVFGAVYILSNEGSRERYTAAEPLSPRPENGEELISLINDSFVRANELKPRMTFEYRCRIDTDSFVTEPESKAVSTTFLKSADALENYITDRYHEAHAGEAESCNTEYFDDISSVILPLQFSADSIEDYSISCEYGWCSACETRFDTFEEPDLCPNCSSEGTLSNRCDDCYSINIILKNECDALNCGYFTSCEFTAEAMDAACGGFCSPCDFLGSTKKIMIEASLNRITGRINEITFSVVSGNSVSLDFGESYPYLKKTDASFEMTESKKYSFSYPCITLDSHSVTVAPGESSNLIASLTCDDPGQYTVKWESSNPGIVSVDEQGYFKAGREYGEAVITASYVFGGSTFTDACKVRVGIAAESVDLSRGKLKLNVGGAYTLEAKIKPSDASDSAVDWLSSDESVAVVENGRVTAVGKGKATIYVLTHDGDFYSSCETEVR